MPPMKAQGSGISSNFSQHQPHSTICRSLIRCGASTAVMSFVQHQSCLLIWTNSDQDCQIDFWSSPGPWPMSAALVECPCCYYTILNNQTVAVGWQPGAGEWLDGNSLKMTNHQTIFGALSLVSIEWSGLVRSHTVRIS